MKKSLWIVLFLMLMCVLILSACNDDNSLTESMIDFSTLKVDGNNVTGEVANEITTFSFLEEIKPQKDVTYTVSLDIYGKEVVPTKTVALYSGNNTFYVLATLEDKSKVYTVTIRRRPIYSVAFDTDGGTAIKTQSVEEGKTISAPDTPTKDGYIFIKWNYEFDNAVMNNIVIKAEWAPISYEITYDANGGSVTNNKQAVKYNSSYILETPVRKGYTFAGWYEDEKRYYDGVWATSQNVTLKAKWNINTYRISYVNNGGIHSNPTIYTVEDEIELATPTKTGYTFIGWTFDGQVTPITNVKISKGSTENKKYTANWSANTYEITYDANGGSVTNNKQAVKYNSSYILETPVRKGYTFAGWYEDEKRYYDGVWATSQNVTLKAKWNINTYRISYVNNGGIHSNPTIYTVEDEIELATPTKTGYTFIGWTFDGQVTPITNVKISKGSTENKKYTANWSANTYDITYDANGGSVTNNKQTVKYNSSYILETPVRKGYTFAGWYEGETRYYGGTWRKINNVTLKAKWDINSYYVSVNGTSGGSVSGEGRYEYNFEVTVSAKSKLGYTWLGWFDDNDNIVSNQATYTFTLGDSNVELKAKWKTSDDIADFVFSSTETTCTITDVVDDSKTTYTIPSYVTSIDNWTFFMCDYLTNITIPNGVITIGDQAFSGCKKLSNIDIPQSVTHIGENAFSSCNSLTSIVIPKNVTSISEYTFSSCDNLTSVVIHSKVTFIGNGAFSGCTKLTSITFLGNTLDWNSISLGNNWNHMVPANRVICSNGIVTLM